jgi:purine-binding chemotaxis protein CheW
MTEENPKETEQQRQIVMFELSGEAYGIDLDIVQEVIRTSNITRVPQTPGFIEGVINLRGYVIPVMDLGKRFEMRVSEKPGKASRIMIVDIEDQILGIAVDKVLEVVTVPEDSIEPPSALLRTSIKSDYLIGFTEINDELVKLLDFNKIFSIKEIGSLKELENAGVNEHAGAIGGQ